jgi:hypothetical protein
MPASKLNVDFSNVSEGGNFKPKHKEAGEYTGRIIKVEDDEVRQGPNKGNTRWAFTIKIDGDDRASYPFYCGHGEKEFWKIRQILVAAGINVPRKAVSVDPNKVVGKSVGVILEDHEYNDRITSSIDELIPVKDIQDPLNDGDAPSTRRKATPVEDDDVDDDPEPEPAPKRRRAAAPPVDDDEDDPEPAPRRRRAAPVEDDDEPAPAPRRRRAAPPPEDEYEDEPAPPPRRRKAAPAPVVDDDDLDLDEDEPAPPPRKRAARRRPAAQDDLEEI